MSRKSIILTIIIVIALVAIGLLGMKLHQSQQEVVQQKADLKGAEELLNYEKKQTQRDLEALAVEVEGYNTKLGNDSLTKLLDTQKQKIKQLLEELRTVKSTNGKRLSQLKDELTTVRKVLINYIRQVDSLNRENKVLYKENKDVKVKITEMAQTNDQLTKDKQALTDVVSRASMLEANNFIVETFNKRDKKTDRLSKIQTIAISFNIDKNVTAAVGEKTIYARIVRPNNEVLTKGADNVFSFENKDIPYSIKKVIEYKGERFKEILYWKVEETLLPGEYKIEMFAEGRLIGSGSFPLKK